MKAAIYDPYLDTLGGGERYALTVADCLSKNGYQVDVFWDDKGIKPKIKERLGIKIERVNFIPNIFNKDSKIGKKGLKEYDLIFFLSDGSIPFLPSKTNILHFQVPFHGVNGRNLLNRIKLRKIKAVVCNSNFTKKFIDKEYGVNSIVLYPPVAIDLFKPTKKENIILSVGRFTDLLHNKRQDVLVKAFISLIENWKMSPDSARDPELVEGETRNWKLILAGADKEGKQLVSELRQIAKGYPIEIVTNPRFDYLKRLYGKAKIFWTATGFGIDENKEPEKVEHFGITTVEAMAAGCVPVVIRKGGQSEIVKEEENGLLWETEKELVEKTLKVIGNQKEWLRLSLAAQKKTKDFSQERFCEKIQKLLE